MGLNQSCVRSRRPLLEAAAVDDGNESVQTDSALFGSHSEGFVCILSGTVVQLYVA